MPKNNDRFYSTNGKRQILVADDEMINRELLGEILKRDYEVLFAADGSETMAMIRQHQDTLSLVLLDILMPIMSGLEVLRAVKDDSTLSRIPIIVTTAERETEVESLKLGAIDFIPKPYPAVNVILARIQRVIELSEDKDIIQSTERDELTGLYNKEFFYRYAEQFDQFHKDLEMDAILVDVNHFHMINERYGRAYGDEVLRRIGAHLREMVKDAGGIVCRLDADTFMVYCPHREDYSEIMERASVSLAGDDSAGNRVRLRMGVYSHADKSIDIERRFDRAKMAADTIKGSATNTIGTYDNQLHQKQLYAEQLIEDFSAAIAEKQFQVYYQPKFDIRPDTPVLTSAEALVRWIHPKLGTISPGLFIPLFEDNGLIQQLDTYVWRETARQIRRWQDTLGYAIPVSVNVSRIDLYDPNLPATLQQVLDENGLQGKDLLLEITESAYTQDSDQIIHTVDELRSKGFQIEMDDFGTGYSSLNMISSLPIDALKLDMQFIRSAFSSGGNTHMLEVIIGIAGYLGVPVIAEGVETEEQLRALKILGCDIVQGYFFSRPVPAPEFEPFILQKKEADYAAANCAEDSSGDSQAAEAERRARQLKLSMMQDQDSASEGAGEPPAPEKTKVHTGIQLRTASIFFAVLAFLAAISLLFSDISVSNGYLRMEHASSRYIAAQFAASEMESASDYLTDRVRCFVVTGEIEYLNDFFEEVEVTRRRDRAVEDLEDLIPDSDNSALSSLNTALSLSNELIGYENLAMRLTLEAGDYDLTLVPESISGITLSPDDQALSPEELRDKAQQLVFDNNYMHYKDRIRENVNLCTQSLIRSSSQELDQASAKLSLLVNIQTGLTIVFLLIVLSIVVLITLMVRKPLTDLVKKMQEQKTVTPTGVERHPNLQQHSAGKPGGPGKAQPRGVPRRAYRALQPGRLRPADGERGHRTHGPASH